MASDDEQQRQQASVNAKLYGKTFTCKTTEAERNIKKEKSSKKKKILVKKKKRPRDGNIQASDKGGRGAGGRTPDRNASQEDSEQYSLAEYYDTDDVMSEYSEMTEGDDRMEKNLSYMTPQMLHALKMSQAQSQLEYQREMKNLQGKYNLDECLPKLPEVEMAKKARLLASKNNYKKGMSGVLSQYKGFQKISPADNPETKQGIQTAALLSNKKYKEDWDYDKGIVCFPATLTPSYDTLVAAQRNASQKAYKQDLEKTLGNIHYDPTKTDLYKCIQDNWKYSNDKSYRAAYEKNKSKYTPLPFTPQMLLSKTLYNTLNWNAYTAYARKLWEHYHLVVPIPVITQAVQTAKMTSDKWYKADFKKECIGKSGPADIAFYPELEQARKAAGFASKVEYRKAADKAKQICTIPADHPDFLRAKTAADQSDIKYKKQKAQTIAEFQGYQRMDASQHPVVQNAAKAAELQSDKNYREDWEYDKQMIYYPAHITPAYEAAADVRKVQSDAQYRKAFDRSKAKNNYDVTNTQRYEELKAVGNVTSDNKYKEEYRKNQGNVIQVPETTEMSRAKELQPVLSKKAYTEKSKDDHKNVNIGSDLQEISHAVGKQKQASTNAYKSDYKQHMVGRAPADPTSAYPEHELHRKVTKLASKPEYVKESEKLLRKNHLPVDAPEFIRAKQAALQASDIEYQKQKYQTVADYRGYQTMDAQDHPVVQRAAAAAEISSDKAYKEDWEYDKQMIYYPVHITPAYEAAADVMKVQSDTSYKKEFEKTKAKNEFRPTDTERYKEMKQVENVSSDVKYKEAYEKNKGKGATPVSETHEMALAKQLLPVLSKKQYREKSKNMQKNVNVKSDIQEISHAVSSQQLASPHSYTKEYKESIVGQGPSDPTVAYPEHDLHRKATNLASSTEYHKDAARMMTQHHLPADAPEFVRAKEAAKNASDREYQKQRKETIDNYKGFQTMDSSDHPVVQRGIKAAELASDTAYREDWEYDKQMIYYPVHITPAYEAAADVRKIQSDKSYKKEFEKTKAKNEFRPTDTERYKEMKQVENVSSDVKYKEAYEKNKGKGATPVSETHEMALAKQLLPVLSKKQYSEKAKNMQKNVNVKSDIQEISHAVSSQQLASPHPYTKEYKESIVGQGPSDPTVAYPEHDLHRKATNLASSTEYHKDAARMMTQHHLPVDAPEFVRAKEAAKNASDREYQKQRKETIDNYKGFQTMDSSDHPVVQRGIKAAELASDTAYREDWEYDKQMIYYPVHITPAYEAAADVRKIQSDTSYKKEFEKTKAKNEFRPTDTERYKEMKQVENVSSDVKYKEAYEKNKGKGATPVPETHEMALAKQLLPVLSKKQYSEKAKNMQKNVNVKSDIQEISHAVSSQQLASPHPYTKEYKESIVGQGPSDPTVAYPEHDLHRKATNLASSTEYHKDAARMMTQHHLPVDAPEFVRAKEAAKNASDREYQKQRKETIDNYKGFQTMDSSDHPVVQRGIKAAELASDKNYREDWEYDKQVIYYPVHLTPAYEAAADVRKIQSDVGYKQDFEAHKAMNDFRPTDTEQYKDMKRHNLVSSDVKYKEEYEKNKGQGHSEIPETHEMTLAKELKPVQSKKMYTEKSKKMHKNVNIGPDVQEISHAVNAQKLSSEQPYLAEYKQSMVGKGRSDPANAYPEVKHHKELAKLASQTEYQKEAEKIKHHHNIPLDYPEFVRAKEAAKNASDIEYQKQRKETIDNYKGFQTMDSSEHPVVQRGIKAAELASDSAYREDWEYDKQMIYYPVHITPAYEAAVDIRKVQSDSTYKGEFEKNKDKNKFNVTDTERYKAMKEIDKASSDVAYREAYEQNRGKGFSQIPETREMKLSKNLKPIQSTKLYTEKSKEMRNNFTVGPEGQDISHALSAQKLSSDQNYKADYEKNMLGKRPDDVVNSYPEYEHLRKVAQQASTIEYHKDAEKILHHHNLPLDYPEFVRAKETAKNASDMHYKKQRKEVIDAYRGFQTMDSKDHPVVKQGIKAAELASDSAYREDWEYDKQLIYYPVHITPAYEAAVDIRKVQSDNKYKEDYEKTKDKNKFLATDTTQYKALKDTEKMSSDVKYKEEYEKNKGQGHSEIPETHEMTLAKALKPVQSKKMYTEKSKKMHKNVNIGPDVQEIALALSTQKLASDVKYHADYEKDLLGKAPADTTQAYPEYERLREVSKMLSKAEYEKEAEKIKHHHNIPLDYPEFIRAKEAAKNASDIEYQKQRKETIDNYKGFQTMDSSDHPVVQRGIKAAELASDKLYREDWEYEKNLIYYPVHITPGYEHALEASKFQSLTGYTKDAEKDAQKNQFKPTDTEHYQTAQKLLKLVAGKNYTAEYLENRDKDFHPPAKTFEMAISDSLTPLLSNKCYTEKAKKIMQKYNLDSSTQGIAHALSAQNNFSPGGYVDDFKKSIVGKAPSDLVNSYPEYDLARNMTKLSSKIDYVKEADKMMHTHHIPHDYPEFVRAKENAKNASDIEYKKQRGEVIEKYRGFQTMDSQEHPIVQQGIKAAALISNQAYKEDWEYDKALIYYPAHITPGYEAAVQASKVQSDASYKKEHEASKSSNKFNVTDTDHYKTSKDLDDRFSERKYREAYEAEKGKKGARVTETPEMKISKSVGPLLSVKLYGDDARRKMQEYNLDTSMQAINRALAVQKVASTTNYLNDFKKTMLGKAPADLANSYPEYEHARKISKLSSKTEYHRDAEKKMHTHNIPIDYPEFVRAKENAKNASDIEYKKQRGDVISNYRGFQTMDSQDHPVVQHGIRVADLISDRKYKEDYMADKDLIYYPVHLTAGYEAAVKSSEMQSDVKYKKESAKELPKNKYLYSETDLYKTQKNIGELRDRMYKGEYPRQFTAVKRTPEMDASNMVRWLLSNSAYTKEAKKRMDVYNVDLNDQRLLHARRATQLSSDQKYREEFLKEIKGKTPADVTISHPEYDHAKQVSKLISKTDYVKDAEKIKHMHHLPVDYPEFVRARECAKNASDIEYQKQRQPTIDQYRGFQTMDSKDHPVVQHGIKAADLSSHRKYIEDYLVDRNIIYYPVHLTPGYEAAIKASQYQSELKYRENSKKSAEEVRFDPTQTDQYKTAKETQQLVNDKTYNEEGRKKLATEFTPEAETSEMLRARKLKPLAPYEYQKKAKDVLHKYHLNVELPEITHALCLSQLLSKNNYLKEYNETVKGAAPSDLANSYPEYIHARNVSNQNSKSAYTKDGEQTLHHFTMPVDTLELNRAKESAKNASDLLYKKQRKEVIDAYRGFQTMDSKDHPVVKQGLKAAELMSERKYKEDYMADKDLIYYPVHLTAGYEAAVKSSEIRSDTKYKAKHEAEKQSNRFDPVQTQTYETGKAASELLKDRVYQNALQDLSKDVTVVADSISHEHNKAMKDLMSNKLYTENAKKALDKYNINSDVIQIAHALLSTPLLSDVQYRKAFMKEVKGKGISGAGLDFYPDYVKALENTKLSSKNEYSKENEKVIHHYTMPLDTPELSRAKESAINASDLHYKKQRKETIDAFRGFQTMDSKDHPVVQHGIKAADLISDRKYKEDYMADKDLIYYPVHLTAGYEAATKASQYIHGPNYQKAYKRDRDKVRFDVTQTEAYKGHQDQHKFADVRYKVDPASLPFTQVADGPDMVLAKTLKPLVSYWFYKDQAKKMLDKYHIDVADQRMVHALHANDLYSEKKYKDQWEKEIKGKMSNDNLDSYPEYIHAMKTAKNVSQIEYGKGLKKHRNEYTIPPDMPSIKLAKDADKMISANEYGKQLKQTIDGYRGFQTMDSKHHPVVQRGIKAADLISERKYKEDYLAERNLIYYPFHLTSVYETAIKASKFTSEADYKKWFNDNIRGRGNFQVHLAPGYEQAKQLKPFQSDRLYRQKYEETKSEFTPIVDGHDMKHVKVVQPWLSQKKYKQEARKLMGKYHLDVEVPEIAHALFVSSLSSPFEYKKLYENEMKGVGAKNLEKSPYMEQLLKASKLASKVDYGKTSDEGKNLYTLDIETTDIKQALLADKLTSDLEYKKGAKEALSSCQGYHKLGVDDLPRYKKLREIGQNTSDVKYKEEYNDMKKYVYFPYHITPEYEKHSDASKFLSPAFYTKGLKENLGKQNFKYHEIPAYAANKELQALMSVARLQKEREEMLALGYHMPVDDVTNEHVKEVQKRISSNLYKAAARDVMDKYNITADLPQIKQAVIANKLASDNVYKDEYNHEKGTGMDYAPDIPIFKHARNVRSLTSDKSYKDEAHQALHQYAVVPDTPNLIQAKIASQQQSDVEYKRKGKDESAKCKAYQHLRASEQRDVAHARKVNDIISPSKYKEEYNEIRNIIYFPVHLTDGYESALKANKFASPANYKKGWMDSRYKNNFRVHETEGYQLERAIQKKISDIGYKADYKKSVGKCPYVTETMERAHHRNVKDMMSGKRYRQKADEIMDKYHLITDEPRMLHAIRAMDLFSDNKYKEEYEHEKGTWMSNSLETPQMRHALKMKKLTSEIPYKEAALNDLPKVHIPEDASAIKHASEAGKLVSEISYKKDAKENQLKGFNKIDVKDNYVLNHLNQIKDLPSEVHYKKDLYEQKGQAIPVVDTPENLRVAKQQKLQSDNIYKKDLEKLVKGRGLSTDRTPELQHAKEMTSLHSENKYKEGTKDQHEWKSGEAINTPTAVKAKETNQLTSDYKYKEKYEKSKGRGCDVITPAISHAKDAGKLVSENAYKEKFKKDSLIPAAYTVLPSTPQTEQAQKVAQKISDIKYKQEHLKEDIGLPSELKDSLLIRQNQKATDLQSNIEYKKQGELEAEAFKGYQKCLNETPQVLHAKKVKDILSDIKYKEVYENEKGIFFYPYFLTPQYETQVKAGKLQSQITYTKKAEEGRNDYHLSADQPNFKQAKLATELLSDLKYRQPHQGKAAKIRDARDVPSILHSKKMQDLFSDNLYRSNYEKIKDQYHLDVSTPTMINAKRAGKLLSDISYKKQHNKEKGKPFDSYNDSFQMKHLRSLPEMLSDLKYKQDLILSKGKVIQVDDTPWLTTFKQAQQFISDIKYGKEGSANLKTRFQPDKFNKHVKQVTENISDKKYHDDYETFFRGNLIPLPETPETRQVLQNSKLLSEAEYRQKAKEGLKKYLIIPDHPEFKRLRDVANYFSDLSYKDEAGKQRSKYTSVADTPVLRKAKENLELQSEVAYKGDAKAKLATDYALPEEGTRTMQQQRYATTLTSDKTYKDEGERIKHEPTAFRNLKATRETEHAKKVGKNFSQIKYSENAKKDLQHIHPVETDPWIEKAMETSDNISDIKYKAKDKDFLHNYRLKDADDFMKHAKNVRDNISDIKYKADYIDNIGLCWCLPDERRFEHARKVADLFSDNKYKQEAKKMKGKYHITTDTPEYERLRKVQADISEVKYKEGAPDRAKEFTILECTPDIQHAAAVSNLVSKNKYKEAFEKSKGRYTVLKDDSAITHATHVDKLISQNEYKKKAKSDRSKGFTLLADRPDTEHLKQVQRNVSNVEYRRKAKEAVDKNFTVLESTPDVQHAINTAKLQSNMHYKQKLEGKDTADLNTPAMKHAIGANRLQSELEYRKAFEKKVKGKGWKFIKDTPQQKHAEEIGKVQSQYKYTKKHRDSVGQVTSITDRPDILHAVSSNDMISDYEYKRRHRDMAGKGYTFTPDTPSQVHAEEATEFQSELRYRRKYGNKGKAWQAEESPFLDHYKDAQKLVDNVSYRKNAKEINSRGASIAMEETPSAAHCRKAQEILDSRRYKADFEKDVKGHGMTYDLHGTPAMDHVRRAEDIKSEKLYKEHYETNVKGRPTVAMDNPHIISAQKANHLISDVKYKQQYNESKGRAYAMAETPEMRRVRENQRTLSQVNYKSGSEMMKGKQTSVVLDTPELRRVRQNTVNCSKVLYKDKNLQGASFTVLDTPEFRTAKQNAKNFSQIKYQEDRDNMKGKVSSVVDDLTLRRVKQATLISSDLAYKGAKGRTEEMERMRSNIPRDSNTGKAPMTTNIDYKAQQSHVTSTSQSYPRYDVVRSEPVKRWRRNPGSIFDYDPSDYETDVEYEEGKRSGKAQVKSTDYAQSDVDEDYQRLLSIDPVTFKNQTKPWSEYLLGREYKHVAAPSSVPDYEATRQQRMNFNFVKGKYRALYDYAAADTDEITFRDGDVIVNVQPIDEGWMFGTCLRTGQTGMLPANYVELTA